MLVCGGVDFMPETESKIEVKKRWIFYLSESFTILYIQLYIPIIMTIKIGTYTFVLVC